MRLTLRQEFPLGRFHATPWRVNPFDDPHGEWPPSPWRLVRSITARWYQWVREAPSIPDVAELERLQSALCSSTYSFHLPSDARRGSPLRQYHPTEFGNKAGLRSYGTRLVQDNYWSVAPEAPLWWFVEGEQWTPELTVVLDLCLERVTYFGRAEALTRIRLADTSAEVPEVNCTLTEQRTAISVPVLTPLVSATRADVERVTDDAESVKRSVPPGARVLYATRPPRPPARESRRARVIRRDCHVVQFALAANVVPELRAIVRLTARFRGSVLRELVRIKTGDSAATWSADGSVREAIADMVGKDAEGAPLEGHRHTEFLAWCEDCQPTRLLVWRGARAFDEEELEAIFRAAARDLSWAAAGPDNDDWKVRLIPLDGAVPPPPGFDGTSARHWESVTPYVPPRHHLRGGKERQRESLVAQVRRELLLRGFPDAARVQVETLGDPAWVAVHVPRREARKRAFIGDRRGQAVRLTFPSPVAGPIRLGHSSSFGLGLFQPVQV
jgi:CRISPR-associated protein Csb2